MLLRLLKSLITPQYRPLSHIRDSARADVDTSDKPELGLEGIDMRIVHQAERRNQALDRTNDVSAAFVKRKASAGFMSAIDLSTTQSYDDKDYAKRYYAHFQKNKDREK